MNSFLLSAYIILMLFNLFYYSQRRNNRLIWFLSLVLLVFLMSANHNVTVINGKTMDLFYYERDYYLVSKQNIQDSVLYYLFFTSQLLANTMGASYYTWLTVSSILCILSLFIAIRKFDLDIHYVLFFFMYYVIAFYTGLKYFYGMIPILFGLYYLTKQKKAWFVICVIIAGGLHPMYYFFLTFLFIDSKYFKPKYIFRICVGLMLVVIVFGKTRFINAISSFLYLLFERQSLSRSVYFTESTNLGFLIPIMLHIVTLIYSKKYLNCVKYYFEDSYLVKEAERLYSINQMCILLYPLFLIAVTFSRYITVVSFVTIALSSNGLKRMSIKYKQTLFLYGIIILVFFGFYFYYVQHYWEYNLVPFFTV